MSTSPGTVAGVVLAAGAGTRMGGPKAELLLAGERLLDRAVRVLSTAGCGPVLAVVRDGTVLDGAVAVVNETPERGMRSSLLLAVAAAREHAALAVLLADLPGVDEAAVRSVVAAWRPGRIAVGRYRDGTGHPIVMSPQLWSEALACAGPDEGARAYLREHPDLVDVVPVDGSAADLDTPEDVGRWTRG